jgi:hypothetical protein
MSQVTDVSQKQPSRQTCTTAPIVDAPAKAQVTLHEQPRPLDDVRRALKDQAVHTLHDSRKSGATPAVDLVSLSAEAARHIDRDFAGLSADDRSQIVKALVRKTTEQQRLSEEQSRRLQEVLLEHEQEQVAKRSAEIAEAIERLAQEKATAAYDPKDVEEAFGNLKAVVGRGTSQAEAEDIAKQFVDARQSARKAQMLHEVGLLGAGSVELGSSVDMDGARAELVRIREKYKDVQVDNASIINQFKSNYDVAYDRKASEVNFVSRAYYATKRWAGDVGDYLLDGLSSVGDFLGGAKDVLVGGAKLAGDAVVFVGEKLKVAGEAVGEFAYTAVTDPKAALEQTKNGIIAAKDAVVASAQWVGEKAQVAGRWVGEHGWSALKKVGEIAAGPVKGFFYAGTALGQGLLDVGSAIFGDMSWREVGEHFRGNMAKSGEAFVATGRALYSIGAGVCRCAKSVSDSIGLSDLLVGAGHLVAALPHAGWDLMRIATGNGTWSELKNNFIGHGAGVIHGVVGAGKCFLNVTGIMDLWDAGSHACQALAAYGRGDKKAFAIHSAFAAGHLGCVALSWKAIAATVGTAGAAAVTIAAVATLRTSLKEAVKLTLKEAGRQFFKESAKEVGVVVTKELAQNAVSVLGKQEGGELAVKALKAAAVKELGEEASKEAQQKLVADLAFKNLCQEEAVAGAKESLQKIAAKGAEALSTDTAFAVCKDVGEQRTKAFLRTLGLPELVDKHVLDLLNNANNLKTSKFTAELMEKYGLAKNEAKAMAKDVKKALKSGKADGEIKTILEEGISKPVSEALQKEMEQPFKSTMRKGFQGELDEAFSKELSESVAKKATSLGKTVDGYTDDLVEASWKGYREGIELAVKSLVREGIDSAFKKFREGNRRMRGAGSAGAFDPNFMDEEGGIIHVDFKAAARELQAREELKGKSHITGTRVRTERISATQEVRITEGRNEANEWEEVSREVRSSGTKAA